MTASPDSTIRLDHGKLDLRRGAILRGEERIPLTTKEVELLRYLSERASQDVPREELLTEVWGYAATSVTRAIDTAVKRLRKKLEEDPSRPRHLLSVHGVGYRFEASDREPSMVPRPRVVAPPPPAPEVPADGDLFVGREDELAELDAAFAGARLVTLRGPAGVGKSRLAREYARRQRLPVAWVSLSGVAATALRGALAEALGAGSEEGVALVESLRARGPLLVLLDDADGVLVEVAAQVRPVLHACPDLKVVVTARAPLGVPEERVCTVAPLATEAGVALLVERARIDTADGASLVALVDALDRLPLAIELAAPRARVLPPDKLLARLDQRFRVLARRRGSEEPGLEEAIAFSWDLLDDDERAVLADCSVFRGGFSAEAAEAVAEPEDPGAWVIDLLEGLEEKSMIHRRPLAGGGSRLELLESVRAFAAARAEASGRAAAARARHRTFFVGLGEELIDGLYGPQVATAARRMGLEHRNLTAAWEQAPPGEERARLALVLGTQGVHAGTTDKTAAILEGTALDGLPGPLEARLRVVRTWVLRARNRFGEARAEADKAAAIAERVGDGEAWLDAETLLGGLDADEGDLRAAAERLGAARAKAAPTPTRARLTLLGREAMVRFHRGEVDACEELIGELLAGALSRGSVWFEHDAYRLRAGLRLRRSRLDEALADARRAQAGFAAIGARWREGLCHELLGAIASFSGRHDEAEREHGAAVELYRRLGRRHELPRALGNYARAHVHQGNLAEAREAADQALAVAREQGSWRQLEETAMLGGTIALAEERWEDAIGHFSAGVEQAESVGEAGVAAIAYAARAFARLLAGDPDAAAPDNARARAIFEAARDQISHRFHLGVAAIIAVDRGDAEEARRLLASAEAGPELPHPELALWLDICRACVRGPTPVDVATIEARLANERASAFVRALAGHLSRKVAGPPS